MTFRFPGGGSSSPEEYTSDSPAWGRAKFGDDRFFLDESPFPMIEIGSRLKLSKNIKMSKS